MLNIPMPLMPKVPCRPGVPPPRVPESLQWPMSLLLEKFTKYRAELVKEVVDVVGKDQVKSVNGRIGDVTLAASDVGLGNVANTGDSAVPVAGGTTKFTTGGAYAELAKKVSVADLFDNPATAPTVKSSLLPSYVDDVLEYTSLAAFPQAGETGKIYIAKDTNKTYRWSGTQYTEIANPDLSNYVQKVPGKGLSTNDYDNTEKGKVATALQPEDIDSALSTQNKAADAKATGDALAGKLSKAEAEAGFTEWTISPYSQNVVGLRFAEDGPPGWYPIDAGGERVGLVKGDANSVNLTWGVEEAIDTFTATRTRLPTMADIPTKTSDLTNDSGFLTQHQQLMPVYSQTPTFSEWSFAPAEVNGDVIIMVEDGDEWFPSNSESAGGGERKGDSLSTSLTWGAGEWWGDVEVTATRVRTDIIGYTLGSQATKPLQPQGDYAPATNIAKTALASDVQTSLGKADTAVQPDALAGAVRYDLPASVTNIADATQEEVEGGTIYYAEATLADRKANWLIVTTLLDELRLTFPAVVSGKVRDFGLRLEIGSQLTAPALVMPVGVTVENPDGAIPELADGTDTATGVTLLYFSETAPGVFLVKGEEAKEVA